MINFEKELQKFKPILNVNHIEQQITQENMTDIIDLFRKIEVNKGNDTNQAKEISDKE